MNRAYTLRLLVMGALAAVLAARMGLLPGRLGAGPIARGSAGVSSGEDAVTEEGAAHDAPAATGARLTAIAGRLTDAAGRGRTLAEFRGAPFVAGVLYTRCTSICPRLVAQLVAFEKAAAGGPPPKFVMFSLDPAHDTPEALRAFMLAHALDSTRWTLLVPEPGMLPPLASALGVAWRPGPDGGIAHSAVIAMIDSAGRVRDRRVGLSGESAALVAAWRAVQ